MAKCSICKINEAVIYTTRFESGMPVSDGICLKCAFARNMAGMDEMFTRAGVNESNIDELTERMNTMIQGIGGNRPEDLFRMILSGEMPVAEEEVEEEEPPTSSPLLPVSIGPEVEARETEEAPSPRRTRERKLKFLEQFATNLTQLATQHQIDQIVGRKEELARVIQILNRRNKNNPVLLGEPGVGKTAIAEGLADKIVKGEVPNKLLNQEVYLLDMTAMVAGTQFRGQFESRMKGVVDDARRSGNVILVIDELHNIMGAGDAEGAMNAANILKPALARGEIRVVGSTTLDEYRRFIEKDSALERRFQKVIVEEPNLEESFAILQGVRTYYEEHHYVRYADEVLRTAIEMSDRYIHDRYLPDKAIDLIDEAGSRANLDNRYLTLKALNHEKLQLLEEELDALDGELAQAKDEEDKLSLYERQAELKSRALRLRLEIHSEEAGAEPVAITSEDIARVVELWTGIPVRRISETETEKLLRLEERLHERVIGQKEAIIAVANAVRRHRAGFGRVKKPSSFIFVGPTGVGKTELVKALAEALFETEEAMIRLDMSEFMEPHTVSKLIGSPPGYVGYDDGGQLTEKIRRKPYSVILLDEIEKAHADVFNILLQILDDGRLTDSHGRVVSFANTILIMTSNAGTTLKGHGIGFGSQGHVAMESRVQQVLQELFRPEFLNRVDETIVFHELSSQEIRAIVDLMLREVEKNLRDRGLELAVDDGAREALAREGYDPRYGARPLRKVIVHRIEDRLADLFLSGRLQGMTRVLVRVEKKEDGTDDYIFDTI